MSSFDSPRSRSKLPIVVFVLVLLMVAGGAAAYFLWPRLESAPPQISVSPDADTIGVAPLQIRIADAGTGIASIKVTLAQDGTEHAIATDQFAPPVRERTITLNAAKLAGVKEGPAVLRVVARDAALWRGNEATQEKKIAIDITPPTLELIADDRYINFGGTGVIAYKASSDTVSSGVKIGERFFPGVAGVVKDQPDRFLVFFAQPYDAPADARAVLVATDQAGNRREMALSYEVKNVRYRKSTISVSEAFLNGKVAPLLTEVAARQAAPKDVFVAVNREMRKENEARIAATTGKVTPAVLWNGVFAQLSNSKVEANFADERTYLWNGEAIDHALHLGYDLSVTKNTPVEAANAGTVVFAGDLGIYGNTVIVDHGLGLFTLYSHLSAIDVKPGDRLDKRQILGKTGETGLAAGDHLHFGVYLHGVAVLPVEWWDAKWIDDNVTPKLLGASAEPVAEVRKPTKTATRAAPKGVRKKRH